MKAIVQDLYGSADVLKLRDVDRPAPRDDEVLIKVHAAGVDPGLWHLLTGKPYLFRLLAGLRKPRQRVQGSDVAGTVEQVGAKVAGFEEGDEVFGAASGAFAEYVCGKLNKLARKPENLTFEQAAVLPVSGLVAYQALHRKIRSTPGQKILIIGASGGIGTYAVQLAVALGLEVTGVCGPGKGELLRSLGASEVVDYTREDVTEGKARFDLIMDVAGNRPLRELRRVLAPRGQLLLAGGENGGPILGGMDRQFRAMLLNPFTRQKLGSHLSLPNQPDLEALAGLAEKGEITPVIDRTYPLPEAADAIRHLETGHPKGKLVVTI